MLWKKICTWLPLACLMYLVPADFAATIPIDENVVVQANLRSTATPGTVLFCEFFQTFGAACTAGPVGDPLAYVSDQLRFTPVGTPVAGVTVTLCSNADSDDTVDGSCGLANFGTIVRGEGLFGGFDYTPGPGDPGFDLTLTTQNTFHFAGDIVADVPEPASFSLAGGGVLLLFLLRLSRHWNRGSMPFYLR